MGSGDDKIIVETLIKESTELRKLMFDSFLSADRYLTIAMAVLVGGFTVGLSPRQANGVMVS